MKDANWQHTLDVYRRKTDNVLKGKTPGQGNHVPVYAYDLQLMLEELKELEVLRAQLGKATGT